MATVKLTGVKKIYDKKVVAVQDFNLDIADKEFVVFVGPSGCGKSTTLRMIAGLEDISEGTVEIDGVVVNDFEPRDRDIAMVFQNYALYPHLTVFENMAFALRIRKVPNDEIYKKVTEAAKILGITEYLTRKPKALSGGQRQRVAIGRAMVRESKVFLMDEPLSNLDAKLRNQMRAEIIRLRKRINSTFIYVTHDQTEAMTLGDRIVIMKDGFIQQVGTPEEVFDMPVNLFVAGFIGAPQMNFFKTTLVREGDRYYVTPFGTKMELSKQKELTLSSYNVQGGEITLGVRPEHITIVNEGEAESFPVTVDVNEMMGSEFHLHVICPDESKIVVRVPTLSLSAKERQQLSTGNTIYVHFGGDAIHVFDTESTRNLLISPDVKVLVAGAEEQEVITYAEGNLDKEQKKAQKKIDKMKEPKQKKNKKAE